MPRIAGTIVKLLETLPPPKSEPVIDLATLVVVKSLHDYVRSLPAPQLKPDNRTPSRFAPHGRRPRRLYSN